ncbi:MAG: hypothetical protein ACJAU1_001798 [Psychromonas sp.]|jgi:hypothetical protein
MNTAKGLIAFWVSMGVNELFKYVISKWQWGTNSSTSRIFYPKTRAEWGVGWHLLPLCQLIQFNNTNLPTVIMAVVRNHQTLKVDQSVNVLIVETLSGAR